MLVKKEHILINLEASNWEDAVFKAGQPLVATHDIDPEYLTLCYLLALHSRMLLPVLQLSIVPLPLQISKMIYILVHQTIPCV